MFQVTNSTLRNWCKLAKPFLSENARPPEGSHKSFTVDDLRVFAVIKSSPGYDSAYLALRNGERGDLPSEYMEYKIAAQPREQVMLLQTHIMQLEAELESLKGERDARLKAEGIQENLQIQLKAANETIIQLRIKLAALGE